MGDFLARLVERWLGPQIVSDLKAELRALVAERERELGRWEDDGGPPVEFTVEEIVAARREARRRAAAAVPRPPFPRPPRPESHLADARLSFLNGQLSLACAAEELTSMALPELAALHAEAAALRERLRRFELSLEPTQGAARA